MRPKPDRKPDEEARTPRGDFRRVVEMGEMALLGFGNYRDWRYGDVLTYKPNYVAYVCEESEETSQARKQFTEWIMLAEYSIQKEVPAASAESK